jgi:hypothetical protein
LIDNVRPYLDNIQDIHCQEDALWSDDFKIAGRVDCIAEYEGVLSVIDFKSAKKEKPETDETLQYYRMQCAAYAAMYYTTTGVFPGQGVILISNKAGTVQEFKLDTIDHMDGLLEKIKLFHSSKV